MSNGQSSNVVTLNASGEATLEFRVGMQPGNNYRLAATVFPTNNLSALQVTNETASGFVPTDTDEVKGGFNGALSPLLTVWRKLHLELDSMTAVPTNGPQANFVSMAAAAIKTNTPNAGQTTVYLRITEQPWQANRYENGTLSIAGISTNYPIIGQGADRSLLFDSFHNYVVVAGNVPSSAGGAICQLRDDDGRWLSQLTLPQLPMDGFSQQIISGLTPSLSTKRVPGVANVYRPAFIEIVDGNQGSLNPRRTIPFFRNKDLFNNPYTLSGVFDSAKDLFDNPLFWAYTATLGFQPKHSEDGDPNIEDYILGLSGEAPVTASSYGYSAVYVESISDYAIEYVGTPGSDPTQDQRAYYLWLLGNVAHEMGHAPGKGFENYTDHAEKGLMQKGGDKITQSFKPASIRRFRTSSSWTGGVP